MGFGCGAWVWISTCVGARMRGVCVGCVVCYQLRFMQICLAAAAEPSPPVDFLLTVSVPPLLSWASCPLCFCCAFPVLRCAVLPFLPTKQIKLFACASKSICVYQIVGLQTKKNKERNSKLKAKQKRTKTKITALPQLRYTKKNAK